MNENTNTMSDSNNANTDAQEANVENSAQENATKHGIDTIRNSIGIDLFDFKSIPDSHVDVDIMLGSANVSFHHFLRLKVGDIVSLDKQAGDGVDIFANQRVIGTGGVQVINNRFAIKIEDSISIRDIVDYISDEQYLSKE